MRDAMMDHTGRVLYPLRRPWRAVGEQIAERRRAAGLTQYRLANALGVSQATIAKLEAGKMRPARALLPRLVALIGGDAEELAGLVGHGEVRSRVDRRVARKQPDLRGEGESVQRSDEKTDHTDRLLATRHHRWHAVGEQLAVRRRAAGLSQLRLAEKVGVTQATVGHAECGRARPSRALLSRIVAVLGGDEEELARLFGYGGVGTTVDRRAVR